MLHPTLPVTGNKHTLGIGWTGSKRNKTLLIRKPLMHPSPRHSTYGSAILAHLFRRRGDHIQNWFRKEEGRGVNALVPLQINSWYNTLKNSSFANHHEKGKNYRCAQKSRAISSGACHQE